MPRAKLAVTLLLLGLAVAALIGGCESDLEPFRPPTPQEANFFAGSATCARCHGGIHDAFQTSGHPHVLERVVDGERPEYPWRDLVEHPLIDPPPGHSWDDISHVVGGFAWAARFLDRDGFLLAGLEAQWSLETGQWLPYAPEAAPRRIYDCGRCHTTGYTPFGSQDGREGIAGTWQEPGVGCEACHGPGGRHAADPTEVDMVVDRSAELCGQCHALTPDLALVPAWPPAEGRGQFIRHENQYAELLNSPHANLTCVTCHDPHRSAVFQPEAAIERPCQSCHEEIEIFITGGGAHTCENCHLPPAVMVATQLFPYEAEAQSHLFRINRDPEAQMFFEQDGEWYSQPFLTLDFTCLRCHFSRDRQWAAEFADDVHSGIDLPGSAGEVSGAATP